MYTTLGCIHNAEFEELVTQSISITGTGNHTALDTKQSCSSREVRTPLSTLILRPQAGAMESATFWKRMPSFLYIWKACSLFSSDNFDSRAYVDPNHTILNL
jgi:hypothetical protein